VTTRRVLIVDDDRQMVETLQNVLRLHGWESDGVYSGEQAIEAVRRTPFAVVLMDLKMTGMDGVSALRSIRAERPRLPVLLMTAFATRETILLAEQEGAVRVFPKPFEPAVLLQNLELTVKRAEEEEGGA